MAIRTTSGGPIEGAVATFVAATGWSDPAVGDLVKSSTAANYAVAECAANDVPLGIVRAVSPSGSVLTVEVFTSGSIARLPKSGTPALGNQIQAASSTAAKGVASAGAGVVVGIGLETDTIDVLFL
jgi:hypothetical protein